MKFSKQILLAFLAMNEATEREQKKERPKFKIKGSHENAKPLPKRRKSKKKGY